MRDGLTRRSVLRRTGAIASVGTVGSVSGCLSCPPVICDVCPNAICIDQQRPAKWVAAPDVFTNGDHGYFVYVDNATLFEHEDELSENYRDQLNEKNPVEEATGLDPEDVEEMVAYNSVSVSKTDFNKDDVIAELEDNGFDEETEHEGYTIMLAADDSDFAGRAIGVSGNRIISGQPTEEEDAPEDVVETVIDVGTGNEDRYVDENDDFDELLSTMSIGTVSFGMTQEEVEDTNIDTSQFEGEVASSSSITVNGETADVESVWIFDRESDVETDDIEDYIESSQDGDGFWADVDAVEVNRDGRTATATGQMATDDYQAE